MSAPTFGTDDLQAALDAGVIDQPAFERLIIYLGERRNAAPQAPRFDFVHLLWYCGALIVIGAMGLFSTTAFGLWGAKSLIATAIVYAVLFVVSGAWLWREQNLHTPGGLLVSCAVGMAPLLMFGLQSVAGYEPGGVQNYHDLYVWIRSSWLPMELGALFAALLALMFFPFPFLMMIVAFALWFMSMDLTPWLLQTDEFTWSQRANVSLLFGVVMLAAAWLVDLKGWRSGDFAFWLHLFGLMAFWGGLTAQHSADEVGKAFYCAVNIGLAFLGLFLMRGAYVLFGGVGVALYLGHLAWDVFQDSVLFPFVLSGVGALVIGAGLLFHRYGPKLGSFIAELIPASLRGFRPAHAREASRGDSW